MKVVLINETHTPKMGYLGTILPKYLVRLGLEVHVLATDLAAYHNMAEFKSGVPDFLEQQAMPAGTVLRMDGYTVHILRHSRVLGHIFMTGMHRKLGEIEPDIVYSLVAIGWLPLQAAVIGFFQRFQLFTGSHTSAMMFPLARMSSPPLMRRVAAFATRWIPGRFVSLRTNVCYCPTDDCGEVAWRFFGVQKRKIKLVHLGVDVDYFHPARSGQERINRSNLRAKLGYSDSDVVCIYTGKMAEMKNPVLLAKAMQVLHAEGRRFKALFIGDGAQRPAVAQYEHCTVLDFMPFSELGDYYRAADIAAWLTNESTSMLDAAACGIPIIVSDRIYQDHVVGNGLSYKMNDLDSLCDALRSLQDEPLRRELGNAGAKKMRDRFSWEMAAKTRLEDFNAALDAAG